MTNHRLTIAAAIAVLAAALSLYSLLLGNGWMAAAIGAIAVAALAGSLSRLAAVPAAIAATAGVLVAVAPPLIGQGWPGRVAAVIIVAAVAASATGARLLRAVATLATYVAFLLFYLNAVFASTLSFARLIPTTSSVAALSDLPSAASRAFRYSPPIPASRPVEFVAAAGIGVIAACVDLLAVRLRRPALAGLPLLLLFSVPVATSLRGFGLYQTLSFGIAISAYLGLLSADGRQRLRMWGRLVTVRRIGGGDEPGAAPDTRDLAASGRRVGLAAVGLAMIVPIILVGSTPHDLFEKSAAGDGPGGSQPGQLSPLLRVTPQLSIAHPAEVLSYQTDAVNPTQQYLQDFVLNYNTRDDAWLPVTSLVKRVTGTRLPVTAPGLTAAAAPSDVLTTIHMVELDDGPLPVPYAPVRLSDPGATLSEATGTLMVYDNQVQTNFRYSVTSEETAPSKALLSQQPAYPAALEAGYGSYNGPDARQLRAIALNVVGAAPTPFAQAVKLQDWFTSGHFAYTLKPSLTDGRGWLLQFLTTSRRGDCEQFAPAFAVLARLLGIPSRVAVGYTGGTPTGNGWQVTTADAHAWPELYFPGAGWTRFEPTPGGAGQQETAVPPAYTQGPLPKPGTGPAPGSGAPTTGPSASTGPHVNPKLHGLPGATGSVGQGGKPGGGFPVGITVAVAAFLLVTWPAAGRWLTRRRRWLAASGDAAQAHAAWRELLDYLTDYGLGWRPSESPRAIASRIADSASVSPAVRAAVTRIAGAEERARYSLSPQSGAGLHADVMMVRRALAASSSRPQRLRARLLPASTLAVARHGLQSANQWLAWLDSPLPSMRRRFRHSAPHRAG
jgi:transglutaminase-like putative cysteine protease